MVVVVLSESHLKSFICSLGKIRRGNESESAGERWRERRASGYLSIYFGMGSISS